MSENWIDQWDDVKYDEPRRILMKYGDGGAPSFGELECVYQGILAERDRCSGLMPALTACLPFADEDGMVNGVNIREAIEKLAGTSNA